MIPRRANALAAVAFAAAALNPVALADPLPADRMPFGLLDACEAQAEPFSRYAPPIAAAVRALTDIGVFKAEEFAGVRIGFCGLRRAGGPVATVSCPGGIILLDEKYAGADQALVLKATLAHEMKHHFQHQDRMERFGPDYCASERYLIEKPALEAEADAFGDTVAGLFSLGRAVEIVNACDDPVSIYLEAHDPVAVSGAGPAFQRIAGLTSGIAAERALSGRVRFFARTAPTSGAERVWQDTASAETRFVEGRLIRLKTLRLAAPDRVGSPFRLRLSCTGAAR